MSGLELAAVLAQLGLDVREAERRVDLLLGLAGQRLRRSRRRGSRARRRAGRVRTAISRRCTLCAWLPVKCWSRFPNVAGVTTRRSTRSPVWATPRAPPPPPRSVMAITSSASKASVDRRHVVRRDDDVEVLDVVGLAARRARDLGAHDGRVRAQPLEDRVADRHRAREHDACPGRPLGLRVERRDQGLLGLRAEPLQLPDLPGARGRAQRLQRVDAELLVQPPGALGPEALELRHRHEPRRELGPQLLGGRRRAGVEHRRQLLLERLADPGQLGDAALADERRDRHGRLADHLRRVAVGDDAVDDRAVELVQIAELVELRRPSRCSSDHAPSRRTTLRGPHARSPLARPSDVQRGRESRTRRRNRLQRARDVRARGLPRSSSSTTARPTGRARSPTAWRPSSVEVEVLHRTERAGLGPAYLAGFAHALGRGAGYVFEMDSDLSHDPADLARLLEAVRGGRRRRAGLALRAGRRRQRLGSGAALRQPRRLDATRASCWDCRCAT